MIKIQWIPMTLPPPLTVTGLTQRIKQRLREGFSSIQVEGEVSNLRHQSSGHLYFSLKDGGAQVSAVMFRREALQQERLPKEGEAIVVTASLDIYAPRGQYQLIVTRLAPKGLGDRLMELHRRKIRCQERGWFDASHKKALPTHPRRVGVITSPTGAVLRDILHVFKQRGASCDVIINPVRVQGEEAAREMIQAVEQFGRYPLVDLLILARGGGSVEDLWPFQDEKLVEAIFHCPIPLISAVGHETDISLCDGVADQRAPTPSAAAAMAVPESQKERERLLRSWRMIRGEMQRQVAHRASRYQQLVQQVAPQRITQRAHQQIDEAAFRLERLAPPLHQLASSLENMGGQIATLMQHRLAQWEGSLATIAASLEGHSPAGVLKRGYCIPFSHQRPGERLSLNSLTEGESLSLRFQEGVVNTTITTIER
ncbi:MAG: exodeoxyribonuclease VII large subunit [Chlamydiota bacterium]|nr:exodeoxyribonuclease VII large subunit [Chlamydiota bacterium]